MIWREITESLGPDAALIALPGWAGLGAGSLQRLSFLETVTASTLQQRPGEGSRCDTNCCFFFPPDVFPQPDLTDEGLARPVLAGIVATICFLAAAILFSTLAACFVNKQRKRKLKRKKGEPVLRSASSLLPVSSSFLSPPLPCVVVVTFFPVCLFLVRARPQVKP